MYRRFFKRFLDIVCSGMALLILWPVFLVVAILIKIKLGGPVIFTQYRPGKNNKIFKLRKFRTMTNGVDENGRLLPDEQRQTKFGKFLRKTSLDELPQLWCVFIGDMSFIGPRPKLIKDMVFYNETQNRRAEVRPGITGLAQANGRNLNTWDKTFEYDIEYVDHLSFWLDLKILFLTFKKVVARKEIVEQGQTKEAYYYGDHLVCTNQITEEEYKEKLKLAATIAEQANKNKNKNRIDTENVVGSYVEKSEEETTNKVESQE